MARGSVYGSVLLGAFFIGQLAATGSALYVAFVEGCGATAVLMLLTALAQRLHAGDRLQSIQLPGGAGAEFERSEAVEEVRGVSEQALEVLTERVEEIAAVQERLIVRLTAVEEAIDDIRLAQ